jgi:hypothetical protein
MPAGSLRFWGLLPWGPGTQVTNEGGSVTGAITEAAVLHPLQLPLWIDLTALGAADSVGCRSSSQARGAASGR